MRVLVINYDSPLGSVSQDFIRSAEDVIRTVFHDRVEPYMLFYRDLVD